MKLFKWQFGRQPNGKYKFLPLIWSKKLFLDCYIIRFPEGAESKPHFDNANKRRHYRLNIILWKSKKGGEFKCEKTIFSLFNRIHFFRPDLNLHSVTKVEEGTRYVFSIGKTLKAKT